METLKRLFKMFYPLEDAEQAEWAKIVQLPEDGFFAALAEKAQQLDLKQKRIEESIAWLGDEDAVLLLYFRIPDPRDLRSIQRVYELIGHTNCYLAYVFVNQLPDGDNTWDIFQLSRLSYLAHCNRITGPGADAEA
jgi:hypothetical protein